MLFRSATRDEAAKAVGYRECPPTPARASGGLHHCQSDALDDLDYAIARTMADEWIDHKTGEWVDY